MRRPQGLTDGAGLVKFSVLVAGWSSLVARRAHNPKVAGSNPAPAMDGRLAQLVQSARFTRERS